MMKAIAAYILRGPLQAVVATFGFALVALTVFQPASYLSGAAVALVFLSQGPRQGIRTALLASLGLGLITLLSIGTPMPAILFFVMVWMPTLILAYTLRQTASMANTLLLATVIGMSLILASFVWLDLDGAWIRYFNETFLPQMKEAGLNASDEAALNVSIEIISKWLVGILVMALTFRQMSIMLIARWWQSVQYKPGGFREEFHQLRFGTVAATLSAGMILLSVVSAGVLAEVVRNLTLLLLMLFMFQGLAVTHALVLNMKLDKMWLVVTYVFLVFVMPVAASLLAVAGLVDNWFDFRGRFSTQAK